MHAWPSLADAGLKGAASTGGLSGLRHLRREPEELNLPLLGCVLVQSLHIRALRAVCFFSKAFFSASGREYLCVFLSAQALGTLFGPVSKL